MIPFHQQHNITIYCDDCVTAMQNMEDNSIDAIVTDPPYGLSKQPDIVEVLTHWLNGDDYEHTGGGFMGRAWDSFVPGPSVWRECLRVLKPGGHLLAFAGTRTVDLMGISLRLGGFEIRDTITNLYDTNRRFQALWETLDTEQRKLFHQVLDTDGLMGWGFGSGFPKSLDIGKAIDRAKGMEREVVGISPNSRFNNNQMYGSGKGLRGHKDYIGDSITAPATPEAKQYEGFGTGLKPAIEPVLLCRKPISEKNIAANVLRWGTGGIAIDKCRIGYQGDNDFENAKGGNSGSNSREQKGWGLDKKIPQSEKISPNGRFPANLILSDDDQVRELFPETGKSRGGTNPIRGDNNYESSGGMWKKGRTFSSESLGGFGDSGSAARFFYTAKSSKAERNAGLEEGVTNTHETVKPLALMRYLCRLITPPNGLILDPFAGSGSTLIAAREENFKAIGVELEEDYCQIAVGRLSQVQPNLFNTGD